MSDKKPWDDEPTPMCDEDKRQLWDCCDGEYRYFIPEGLAGDLERRLRRANALIGKLRADTDCGDFDKDDLEQRLANIEEVLTP